MLIKKEIPVSDENVHIQIPLNIKNGNLGLQQEINSFTETNALESINDTIDKENIILTYDDDALNSFDFYFYNVTAGTYNNNYLFAGLTEEDFNTNNEKFTNSFFIFNIYDTYEKNKQTKLTSIYISTLKLGIFDYSNNLYSSKYSIYYQPQMKYLFFPKYLYDTIETEQIYWLQPIFYNAKTGKIVLFNINDENIETNKFIQIKILNNFKWKFTVNDVFGYNFAFYENYIDYQYNDIYNSSIDTLKNLKPNYPKGKLFDYKNINYEEIED